MTTVGRNRVKGSEKQLLLLVFSTYIMLGFLHNLFFLIFLFGLGFGASNKKEIKKLKKKVKLMEHIIGNIHDCIAYLYAWCLCAGNNHAIYQITIYLFHKIYLYSDTVSLKNKNVKYSSKVPTNPITITRIFPHWPMEQI